MTELSREELGDMRTADAAMAELKRQIAEDHKPGYGVHKTSEKANYQYRNGFIAGYEAGAKAAHKRIVELEHGLEIATEIINSHVEEYEVERAVSDRLLEALKEATEWLEVYGNPKGLIKIIDEVTAMRQERKEK